MWCKCVQLKLQFACCETKWQRILKEQIRREHCVDKNKAISNFHLTNEVLHTTWTFWHIKSHFSSIHYKLVLYSAFERIWPSGKLLLVILFLILCNCSVRVIQIVCYTFLALFWPPRVAFFSFLITDLKHNLLKTTK